MTFWRRSQIEKEYWLNFQHTWQAKMLCRHNQSDRLNSRLVLTHFNPNGFVIEWIKTLPEEDLRLRFIYGVVISHLRHAVRMSRSTKHALLIAFQNDRLSVLKMILPTFVLDAFCVIYSNNNLPVNNLELILSWSSRFYLLTGRFCAVLKFKTKRK